MFSAVSEGTVDRGVIPVENSTNGFVMPILDLFGEDYTVNVIGETHVAVGQALLGRKRPSKRRKLNDGSDDGEDYSHIKTLYSHPQAWGQCNPFLKKHFRGVERIDATSTSRAAELVAEDKSGESAAICSTLAAELYGLDILEPSIEERKGNTTRFLVLRKSSDVASTEETSLTANGDAKGNYKTLISFTIPHTQPASLANALACFGKHGINLTSLSSRPQGERKWNYIFFVEFRGRKGDAEVEAVLEEVGAVVESWKWIGSWLSNGDQG